MTSAASSQGSTGWRFRWALWCLRSAYEWGLFGTRFYGWLALRAARAAAPARANVRRALTWREAYARGLARRRSGS